MFPSVSIVSSVLNGAATIGDCIESVRRQAPPAEHIVIDGGSTDGTVEIVRQYGDAVARFVSEPDGGIYDAMNKGIALATGEVIGILNADDLYADDRVLSDVTKVFEDPSVDSCYGDLVYVDPSDTGRVVRAWRAGSFRKESFYRGWMPPHPTFFVRRAIYERCGLFNLALGTAADYELMLRFLLRHGISTVYIPRVLVKMRAGGASNRSLGNRIRANRMDRLAWKVNGLTQRPWTTLLKPVRKIPQFL
ncbi:MAG: glycosyltransferase family 2 protein [Deltaproteobacteria bacterium]